MVRTLTVTLGLALSVTMAQPAWAVSVTPTDLASVGLGAPVGAMMDDFTSPSSSIGDATTRVFYDGIQYVYQQTVFPTGTQSFVFNTEFSVSGFTGLAGWRFSDALAAGAGGTAADFHIERTAGRLVYIVLPGGALGHWNAFEPITFFFASTMPPTIKSYGLLSLNGGFDFGSAEGLAPVPEPGSIALFGSGLVALYAAIRRRRSLKM
jgi:PEP-CTERM motif